MRLCIECAHAVRVGTQWFCHEQRNERKSLVDGGKVYMYGPEFLRDSEKLCGPEAKWFLSREKTA
jgi:hypothetical protein